MVAIRLDHSVLMLGADVVVLRLDDPMPSRKAPKSVAPDVFNSRMNVSLTLPSQNNLNRIFPLPSAEFDGSASQPAHCGPFIVVDPDDFLLVKQESVLPRSRQHPQGQNVVDLADSGVKDTEIDPDDEIDSYESASGIDCRPCLFPKPDRWSQAEIDYLLESAEKTSQDWKRVADLMNMNFGTDQHSEYTAESVQSQYCLIIDDGTVPTSHETLQNRLETSGAIAGSSSGHIQRKLNDNVDDSDKIPSYSTDSHRSSGAPWLQQEIDFLWDSAQSAKFNWPEVSNLMSKKFGPERRRHYKADTIKQRFFRTFPEQVSFASDKCRWSKDAIDLVRATARSTDFDWDKVVDLIGKQFGLKRTAVQVQNIYRRNRFEHDPPKLRTRQQIRISEQNHSSLKRDNSNLKGAKAYRGPRIRIKAYCLWLQNEVDFLVAMARSANFNWIKVADLMKLKFGTERRRYSKNSVMRKYTSLAKLHGWSLDERNG